MTVAQGDELLVAVHKLEALTEGLGIVGGKLFVALGAVAWLIAVVIFLKIARDKP